MSEPEMIQRVARAIHRKRHGDERGWQSVSPEARAAIEAMREPTPEMVAGLGAAAMSRPDLTIAEMWRAMFDAALAEPPASR